jgi:hypothetical protein
MARKARAKNAERNKSTCEFCFVIMPYGNPFDGYYKNIYAPAIRATGLEPIRADDLSRPSSILDDIWRFTRQAKVLLADVSGRNRNVFYELGLAHAIAQPVVLVASSIEDVPFDLRGSRVILFDRNNESWGTKLRKRIRNALEETLQDPNISLPSIFLEAAPVANIPKEESLMLELRKLHDSIRAVQASLPHWLRHLVTTRGEADLIKRHIAAVKCLDSRLSKPISLGEGMRIMGSIFKGYHKAAALELRKATGLSLQEADDFVKQLATMVEPPS